MLKSIICTIFLCFASLIPFKEVLSQGTWENSCVYPFLYQWSSRGKLIDCGIDIDKAMGFADYEGGYRMELDLTKNLVPSLGIYGYPRSIYKDDELVYMLTPEKAKDNGTEIVRYQIVDNEGRTYYYLGRQKQNDIYIEAICPGGTKSEHILPSDNASLTGIGVDKGFACIAGQLSNIAVVLLPPVSQQSTQAIHPSIEGLPPSYDLPAGQTQASTSATTPTESDLAQEEPVLGPQQTSEQGAVPIKTPHITLPGQGWNELAPLHPGWDEWVLTP